MSRRSLATLGAAALAGLLGLTFFLGFEIRERKLFPYRWLQRVDRKLVSLVREEPRVESVRSKQFTTTLLRLDAEVATVEIGVDPRARRRGEWSGGGLASFGDDVLVLPSNGRVYAARSASEIRETRVAAPQNGRAAFTALAEDPAYAGYEFIPEYVRYNDLVYVETGAERMLVVSYTEYHPDDHCVTNSLARLAIAPSVESIDEVDAAADDWTVFFRTEPCLPLKRKYVAMEGHLAGGRLAFDPPSTLYLTSGDYHFDGMRSEGAALAQDPQAQYGKTLAIDLRSMQARIVSSGHRNAQGLAVVRDGRLLAVEHGPRGGDELNAIVEGANYGWPRESYGTTYEQTRIPGAESFGRHDTFERPLFAWVPSVAASALAEVRGFHEAWEGDLLVGALRGGSIYRIRLEGDRAVYAERIEVGMRIRDVHQHRDGRVVLWSDQQELMFLTAASLRDVAEHFERFMAQQKIGSPRAGRIRTAFARCSECHSFEVDDHARSPSLARIFGKPIASTTYAGYSDALRGADGRWGRDELTAFLSDPAAFAPGTSMPSPGIGDSDDIAALVAYLESLSEEY